MKFLFMGDFHEREKVPISRIDNWQKTLDEKASEILKIAKKNKCSAIIETGDFLDVPRISEEYAQTILKRWGHIKSADLAIDAINERKNKNISIPLVGVVGNHEMFGNSMKNFSKTSLSLLEEAGLLKLVTKDKPLILKDGDIAIAITGTDYFPDIEKEPYDGYILKERFADFHIHIVHGFGTNRDLGNIIPHVKIEDIAKETLADITIMGHDHVGFDPIEINGKWFVNPGAVTRQTNSQDEMSRVVKVGILDIGKDGLTVRMVPLKSAQESENVLSREHIDDKKEKEVFLKSVLEEVDKIKISSHKTITDIVDSIASNQNMDGSLKTNLLDRFNKRMVNTNTPVSNPPKYKIKQIVLENFQSHKHSVIDLGDFNVFTGSSGSGKTSILRACMWIMEDDSVRNPRSMIFNDEPYMSASFVLDNGIKITRKIERKKSGFNGYIIEYKDGSKETLNTNGLPIVQKLLGFNYVNISEDGSKKPLDLNFLRQSAGWFFIGDGFTAPDRAKIIGSIYKTHIADSVQKELDLNIKRIGTTLKVKEDDLKTTSLRIDGMEHVSKLKNTIDASEPLILKYQELSQRIESLSKLDECVEKLSKIINILDIEKEGLLKIVQKGSLISDYQKRLQMFNETVKVLKLRQQCKNIDNLKTKFPETISTDILLSYKDKYSNLEHVNSIAQSLFKSHKRIKKCKDLIRDLNVIVDKKENLQKMVETNNQYHSIVDSAKNIKTLKSYIIKCKNSISDLNKVVERGSDLLQKMSETYSKTDRIKESGVLKLHDLLVQTKKSICLQKEELEKIVEDYKKDIESIDVCPTCYQKLNEASKKHMIQERLAYLRNN